MSKKLFGVLISLTLLASFVTGAETIHEKESSERQDNSNIRDAKVLSFGDGVVFICDPENLIAIKKRMLELLQDEYKWPDSAFEINELNGMLQFRMRSKSTDTRDLKKRKELNIKDEHWDYVNGFGDERGRDYASKKEIVAALMTRGRKTEFSGDACTFNHFYDNVLMRQEVAKWAVRGNLYFPYNEDKKAILNKKYWTTDLAVKKGMSPLDAVNDIFEGTVNAQLGCTTAVKTLMMQGVFKHLSKDDETKLKIEKIAGNDPYVGSEPEKDGQGLVSKYMLRQKNIPWNNWIPGDWGYFKNRDVESAKINGNEGSNVLYIGDGLFAHYYSSYGTHKDVDGMLKYVMGWKLEPQYAEYEDGAHRAAVEWARIADLVVTPSVLKEAKKTPEQSPEGMIDHTRDVPRIFKFTVVNDKHFADYLAEAKKRPVMLEGLANQDHKTHLDPQAKVDKVDISITNSASSLTKPVPTTNNDVNQIAINIEKPDAEKPVLSMTSIHTTRPALAMPSALSSTIPIPPPATATEKVKLEWLRDNAEIAILLGLDINNIDQAEAKLAQYKERRVSEDLARQDKEEKEAKAKWLKANPQPAGQNSDIAWATYKSDQLLARINSEVSKEDLARREKEEKEAKAKWLASHVAQPGEDIDFEWRIYSAQKRVAALRNSISKEELARRDKEEKEAKAKWLAANPVKPGQDPNMEWLIYAANQRVHNLHEDRVVAKDADLAKAKEAVEKLKLELLKNEPKKVVVRSATDYRTPEFQSTTSTRLFEASQNYFSLSETPEDFKTKENEVSRLLANNLKFPESKYKEELKWQLKRDILNREDLPDWKRAAARDLYIKLSPNEKTDIQNLYASYSPETKAKQAAAAAEAAVKLAEEQKKKEQAEIQRQKVLAEEQATWRRKQEEYAAQVEAQRRRNEETRKRIQYEAQLETQRRQAEWNRLNSREKQIVNNSFYESDRRPAGSNIFVGKASSDADCMWKANAKGLHRYSFDRYTGDCYGGYLTAVRPNR